MAPSGNTVTLIDSYQVEVAPFVQLSQFRHETFGRNKLCTTGARLCYSENIMIIKSYSVSENHP